MMFDDTIETLDAMIASMIGAAKKPSDLDLAPPSMGENVHTFPQVEQDPPTEAEKERAERAAELGLNIIRRPTQQECELRESKPLYCEICGGKVGYIFGFYPLAPDHYFCKRCHKAADR